MLGRKAVHTLGIVVTSAALAFAAMPLQAESACKGLEKNGSANKRTRAPLHAHPRKDGVKVSGHCRTKSAKKETKK